MIFFSLSPLFTANQGRDDPHALVILAEEELVLLDLESDDWPTFHLPYLHSVHSSAITCSQHVANVPLQLWEKISDAGDSQNKNFSKRVGFISYNYLHII